MPLLTCSAYSPPVSYVAADYHSLTDRQTAWLEKQLSGNWRPSVKPAVEKDEEGDAVPEQRPDFVQIPPMAKGLDQLSRERPFHPPIRSTRAAFLVGSEFAIEFAFPFSCALGFFRMFQYGAEGQQDEAEADH